MTLGDMVATQRKRLRYSQEELARLAGVSREQISKIENNRAQHPSWGDLKNIAHALSLQPRDLLAAGGYAMDGQSLPPERSMVSILRQALAIAEELEKGAGRDGHKNGTESSVWGHAHARVPELALR